MTMLALPIRAANLLTWEGNRGVAEISDFGRFVKLDDRVYDDACDVGFDLWNPKSGRTLLMTLADTKVDDEGDTQVWIYRSSGEVKGEWPRRRLIRDRFPDVEVHILND